MRILAASILSLFAATALAQTAPDRAAIIAGDPPAAPQRLELTDIPRPSGAFRDLFNGRDLTGWDPWLGYPDNALTFRGDPDAEPLGTSIGAHGIFGVVTEDGGPAIRAGGPHWGSLAFREDLADYHLSLEYKWGPSGDGQAFNNGIVYHSHGAPGGSSGRGWREWSSSSSKARTAWRSRWAMRSAPAPRSRMTIG